MAINKVILTGRLTHSPELKMTPSGVQVCKFSIAQNPGKDAPPAFFDCVAWKKKAEFVSRYFQKGNGIEIVVHLTCNTYESKGVKRKVYEIVCDEVFFPSGAAARQAERPLDSESPSYEELADDDELPFL